MKPNVRARLTSRSADHVPLACEAAVPSDCYRIRRLYALWIEQGALQTK